MTATPSPREIPFNYTSADDRQAISHLLGPAVWRKLEELRTRRVTGRSARLLMRFFGEILIHRRNAYLFQELVESSARRRRFFANIEKDLGVVERNANGEGRVRDVLGECRRLLAAFREEVERTPELRRRIQRELGAMVGKEGVLFDPFTLVSHATDATDWRLHLPLAVVMPDDEAQVAPVLAGDRAARPQGHPARRRHRPDRRRGPAPARLRGGEHREARTGSAASPSATFRLPDGREQPAQVLEAEAGVITERAMEHATERGLVFATDPTSAWACTIGGNVAENAGGKDCVQWGTCIDNLVSLADGDALGPALDRAPHRPRAPQDPPRRHRHLRGGGPGRRGGEDGLPAGRRDPQEGALEGHHEQGAGRRAGPAEGGHRRRHHLGGVHPLPGVRGEADALPRVLRPRHGRGVAGDPASCRRPSPSRTRGGRRSPPSSTSTTSTSGPSTTR